MEHAARQAAYPTADRGKPNAEEQRLHPRPDAGQLASQFGGWTLAAGCRGKVHGLATPCGRCSFDSSGTGIDRVRVNAVALAKGQIGNPGRPIHRGGGGPGSEKVAGSSVSDALWNCSPPRAKALTNSTSRAEPPFAVSRLVRWRAPFKSRTRAIAARTAPGQKSCCSALRRSGLTGGWSTRLRGIFQVG